MLQRDNDPSHRYSSPSAGRFPVDWPAIAEAVARELLGNPNPGFSTGLELRWRHKGAFRLNTSSGTWDDFETREHGNALDLLHHLAGLDRPGALDWLRDRGHLPPRRHGTGTSRQPRPDLVFYDRGRSRPSSPTAGGDRRSLDIAYAQLVWAGQTQSIPMSSDHPARLWLGNRNLWRCRFPLPDSVRWLPAEGLHFRGLHQGAGAVVACMAPPSEWVSAWPLAPAPQALHLINVSADGSPSLDRPADYVDREGYRRPGLPKRFRGPHQGAVLLVGNPNLADTCTEALIAEGVADILALTSRFDGVGIAPVTTPRKLVLDPAFVVWVAAAREVIIHADADSSGTGQRAAGDLRRAIMDAGGRARAMPPPEGPWKDVADVARDIPFPPIDDAWESYARPLQIMYPAWPRWEIARQADIATTGGQ